MKTVSDFLRVSVKAGLLVVVVSLGWPSATFAQRDVPLQVYGEGTLEACAYSPNGRHIVTASGAGWAILWDVETGDIVRRFLGHSGRVTSAALSADGTRLLTGSADQTAKLWDVETGREIRTFSGHTADVDAVAISPDANYVMTASIFIDNTLFLWDVETGEAIDTVGWVRSMAFSPDGEKVLIAAYDSSQLRPTIVESPEDHMSIQYFPFGGDSAAFSPDGTRVVTISPGGAAIGDVQTGEQIQNILNPGTGDVAFSPDGETILIGGRDDNTASLWDVETGVQIQTFPDEYGPGVGFSPDGERILTGGSEHTPTLWDVETGEEIQAFVGHTAPVYAVAFSPDGTKILTNAKLRDTETGTIIREFSTSIYSVAFSPNGTNVLTGSSRGEVALWDVETGELVQPFLGHETGMFGSIGSAEFSPDGTRILTASYDTTAILWDVETGVAVQTFSGPMSPMTTALLSPDKTRVLTTYGFGSMPILWDVETGEQIHTFTEPFVKFWPDGNETEVLNWDRDGTMTLCDAENGEEIRTWTAAFLLDGSTTGPSRCYAEVLPGGRKVLIGVTEDTMTVWDADTGETLTESLVHTGGITKFVFSSDGTKILTSGHDGTARLWGFESTSAVRDWSMF